MIVIGGIPVTIHQRRAGITVPYDVIVADYDGETMYVPIDADDDETHWIVEDYPDGWMYVIDEDGYGSMDMEFDVDEMGQGVSLSARVGAITVSGQKFYVVQRDYVPEIESYAVTSKWNGNSGSALMDCHGNASNDDHASPVACLRIFGNGQSNLSGTRS